MEKQDGDKSYMAAKLFMSDRSYIDLEKGKFCCSSLTLVLYLIYLCEDIPGFLNDLRKELEDAGLLLLLLSKRDMK